MLLLLLVVVDVFVAAVAAEVIMVEDDVVVVVDDEAVTSFELTMFERFVPGLSRRGVGVGFGFIISTTKNHKRFEGTKNEKKRTKHETKKNIRIHARK